jgi:hypothetical protein
VASFALAGYAKSYNAGSLKDLRIAVQSQTEVTLIGGQRMAQTRRVGKQNERADLLSAPRFSPYRNGKDHADRPLRPLAFARVASPPKVNAHGRLPDRYRNNLWREISSSLPTK